jgi:predicted amidohydrolase YtcJ
VRQTCVNANVLTMDPGRPRAAAVAVADGRIAGLQVIATIVDGEFRYSALG